MKLNTMDNTPSGALFTNMLALFSFLASVIANPILTSGAANSLAPRANCRLGTCGLGIQCFKANSCVGVNLLAPNWTHCSICSCPGRAYGGRTDPTCIVDTECLNVQLGNRPDPCGHKGHLVGGREASPEPAPQKGNGGVIDPNAIIKNIPDKIPYSTTTADHIASLPEGSYIDPDILKNIKDELAESLALNARSDLMNEFARLVDDGPGGPITPDAAMLERLRPISHPEEHGGCYTVKNGVTVEKRGGCSNVKDDIDIDSDIDVDLRKRGGCYTVENGVVVEKRGGCENLKDHISIMNDIDGDLDVNIHKRGGCYTVENGVIVEKRGGCSTAENDIDIDGDIDSDINLDLHKRGGCYKIESGVIVEKRGGCGTVEGDIDIGSDIDVDLHKRGGCYTIENGVAVEKRGGCGTVEGDIDIDGDIDVDLRTRGGCFTVENGVRVEKRGGCGSLELEVEAVVEKRVGCFVEEGGVVYAKPNCDGPSHSGPPFPRDA
ncbi:hypothetical protein V498_09905 [Pseudogymnoascus sp. VKM F-4517 (FW-2822)]|nr:hypothetical protein V498_09905 [Pseudogymnoascus sp. VKM F-4517 (FW-2822)]